MARKKPITTVIRELKKAAPGKRKLEPIPGADGLYVRISDTGAKSFTIVARSMASGKQRWAAVPFAGDMDTLTAADMKEVCELATAGIERIKRGDDPFPPPPAEPDTFRKVAENWLKRYVRKEELITADKMERTLERLVYPILGKRPITEIKRSEIVALLDRIEDNNGATMADRTLEILRSLFRWHETRHDDFTSPIRRGMARTKPSEHRRERVLSDHEIRVMWPILDEIGPYGGMVKIGLLTGQRVEKVQQMRWQDIDKAGVWTIPEKHRREKVNAEVLPLPPLAIEVVEAQTRIVGNDYVFASPRTDHYANGLSKSKKLLDAKLLEALKAEAKRNGDDPKKVKLEPWVFHSLRHTAKTIMARAGVADFDSERTLGHVIPGIGGRYNHHDFTAQKGAALAKLADEVSGIINPPPVDDGKVVKIRVAR